MSTREVLTACVSVSRSSELALPQGPVAHILSIASIPSISSTPSASGPKPNHFHSEPNHFHPEPRHFHPEHCHFHPKPNHFQPKSNHFAILLRTCMNARPKNISVSRVRGRLNPKPYWRARHPEIIGTKPNESAMKTEQIGKKVERKWKETGKKVERNRPFSRT